MAHAKVPVRASMSKFPGCAVGGVEGKARNAGNGNFISRFFPDPLLAGMLRAEHADSSLLGDDAFLVVSFLPGTSRPRASWREDTRSSRASFRKSDVRYLTTPPLAFPEYQTLHSDEMPLGGVATRIGEAFGPALDAIAEQSQRSEPADGKKTSELFVPTIPHALPVARWARDNEFIRSVLVIDEKKRVKPRLSWYDPYDTTWVPSGWFAEGVMADMNYYFAEEETKAKKP
jgi:hypothetical protein